MLYKQQRLYEHNYVKGALCELPWHLHKTSFVNFPFQASVQFSYWNKKGSCVLIAIMQSELEHWHEIFCWKKKGTGSSTLIFSLLWSLNWTIFVQFKWQFQFLIIWHRSAFCVLCKESALFLKTWQTQYTSDKAWEFMKAWIYQIHLIPVIVDQPWLYYWVQLVAMATVNFFFLF